MSNENEQLVVNLNVMNHKVAIISGIVIKIHHHKKCKRPCSKVTPICQYLNDEMFLDDGYTIEEYNYGETN